VAYYAWRNHYLLATTHGRWWQRLYARGDLRVRLLKTAVRQILMPASCRQPDYAGRTRGLLDFARGQLGSAEGTNAA
jgi:hypothetical protein